MKRRGRNDSSQGFTLTELVVALAVFGIVTLSVVNLISATQQAQRNERYLDLANTTARQIIEQARNGAYDTLVAGQTYSRTSMLPSQLPGGAATLAVSASNEMPDLKRLEVDISYDIGSTKRHVYSTAIIGKGGLTP